MKEAHDAIQAYVVQLEAYKACLKTQLDSAPADTSEEIKVTWLAHRRRRRRRRQYLANQFSYALKAYKEREKPATPAAAPSKP